MRKRRAIVFDNDIVVTGLLRTFLSLRGYDVLTFREPMICPIHENNPECGTDHACADIMIVDFSMTGMNGIEMLKAQSARRCKLTSRNKALMAGYSDALDQRTVEDLGYAFFEKPINFNNLAAWFDECEQRMDLSQPLGFVRREKRQAYNREISFQALPKADIRKGAAVNRSPSGLCLKVADPLRLDQTIAIQSEGARSFRSASVRWIRKTGDDLYLVGLQFENPA
ncbi:MAG: hypothetical protein ACM3MD_07140 [Betaproteobacteria bacterium]